MRRAVHQAFDLDLAENHTVVERQSTIVLQVQDEISDGVVCALAGSRDALLSHWGSPVAFTQFLWSNVVMRPVDVQRNYAESALNFLKISACCVYATDLRFMARVNCGCIWAYG